MFEIGDVVVFVNRLWHISGPVRLNGTVRISSEGETIHAPVKRLRLATKLERELY